MNQRESVSHAAIVDWLARARAAARASAWAQSLDDRGVDLVDVLLSPLFLSGLGAARGTAPPGRSKFGLRERAYQVKVALAERLARLRSVPPAPTDVLFWPRGPAHLEDMQAVWQVLSQRGRPTGCLACQAKPFDGLRSRGMKPTFAPAAWPEQIRAAQADARQRSAALSGRQGPDLAALEPKALSAILAPVWRQTLLDSLTSACVAVANARAALEKFRPKVLLVGNDVTVEGRAGALAAKTQNVPVVVMMHGHVGTNNPLHALHIADRLVAYGDAHRRVLVELGIPAERIQVCGAPYLDQRPPGGHVIHPEIGQAFSLAPGDPWVLVATSGPGHSVSLAHHRAVIENLLQASAAMPEVAFLVKLHRKDDPRYYHELEAKHPGRRRLVVVPPGRPNVPDNILDWLRGCRAVLTGASMVAIEAMMMNVPVITMDFADELKGVEFIDAGATLHSRSQAELAGHLGQLLSAAPDAEPRPATAAFLSDAFFALDGRSAQRVADLVESLIPAGG